MREIKLYTLFFMLFCSTNLFAQNDTLWIAKYCKDKLEPIAKVFKHDAGMEIIARIMKQGVIDRKEKEPNKKEEKEETPQFINFAFIFRRDFLTNYE